MNHLPDVARDMIVWTFLASALWFTLATFFWGVYQWKIVDRWKNRATVREKLLEAVLFYLTVAFFPWSYLGLWFSDLLCKLSAPKKKKGNYHL